MPLLLRLPKPDLNGDQNSTSSLSCIREVVIPSINRFFSAIMSGAMSKTYQVRSDGIFRGLPVLDTSLKGLRAIVVGASGQSGQPVVDVLSAHSNRWEKVYALSRRPPTTDAKSVEHIPVDLLWEPEQVASVLRQHEVQAYVAPSWRLPDQTMTVSDISSSSGITFSTSAMYKLQGQILIRKYLGIPTT